MCAGQMIYRNYITIYKICPIFLMHICTILRFSSIFFKYNSYVLTVCIIILQFYYRENDFYDLFALHESAQSSREDLSSSYSRRTRAALVAYFLSTSVYIRNAVCFLADRAQYELLCTINNGYTHLLLCLLCYKT